MNAVPENSEPQMATEAQRVLHSLVRDFPAPLGPGNSLPVRLQSAALSWEEVEGESVDMGLKLLRDR